MPGWRGAVRTPSVYARVVANLWFTDAQGTQLDVMAPGWLHRWLGAALPAQPQTYSHDRAWPRPAGLPARAR